MEIRTLQYFLAVANEENITRAAEYLHISQPSLSRQLMDLEKDLGVQLLVRGKRKVTLTPEGMILRNRAQEILDLVSKTSSDLMSGQNSISGTIHIGSGETDGIRLITETASALKKDYPGITYSFFSGDGASVMDHLDKGLVDFGLIFGRADPSRYYSLELPYEDTWCALLRRDDPMAGKSFLTPEDLADKPLLLSRQSVGDGLIQSWFGRQLDELNIFCMYNLILNAAKAVEAGLGYALTLENLLPLGPDSQLVTRPLYPLLRDRLRFVWKRSSVFTPAAELFLKEFKEAAAAKRESVRYI